MDNNGLLGEILETGQSVAKKAGDQVKKTAQMAGNQITGTKPAGQTGQPPAPAPDAAKGPPMDFAKDFLQIEQNPGSQPKQQSQQQPQPQGNQVLQQFMGSQQTKSPEEMAKIDATRKKLQMLQHKQNYFDPTFNPPKKQEERPAEKVEREKEQDLMELQEKKKKEQEQPIALNRAQRTTEINRGASG